MKRFVLLVAVVFATTVPASAGGPYVPGDNPALNLWYSTWMDAQFRLRVYNDTDMGNCRLDLYMIRVTNPMTAADDDARLILDNMSLLPIAP